MANVFLRMLMRRGIMIVVAMVFVGIVSLFRGPGTVHKAQQHVNPWSKNYAPPPRAIGTSSSSSEPRARYYNRRTGEPATEEELRDEAYRRQMLREMRQQYERTHGDVDTSSLD